MGVELPVGRERCVPPLSPVLGPESALGASVTLPDLAVVPGCGADFAVPDFVAPHPDNAMTAAKTTPAVMCTRLITSLFRRTEPQDRFQDGRAGQRVQRLPAGGDPEPAAVSDNVIITASAESYGTARTELPMQPVVVMLLRTFVGLLVRHPYCGMCAS